MTYLNFLHSLQQRRQQNGELACYREDAVRALAQTDFIAMQAQTHGRNETDDKSSLPEKLNEVLAQPDRSDFQHSNRICNREDFLQAYTQAAASCDLFSIQKQLLDLTTLSKRVEAAAQLTDGDSAIDSKAIPTHTSTVLAQELKQFHALSHALVKSLNFDLARQERDPGLQQALQQLDPFTRQLLTKLYAGNAAAPQAINEVKPGYNGV